MNASESSWLAVLAMKPKLAILDEPDSGIDALSIDYVVEVVKTFSRNGTTVLSSRITRKWPKLPTGLPPFVVERLKTGDPVAVARIFRVAAECQHINLPIKKEKKDDRILEGI